MASPRSHGLQSDQGRVSFSEQFVCDTENTHFWKVMTFLADGHFFKWLIEGRDFA